MTTYILAGGNDRTSASYGERLASVLGQLRAGSRLLSCFFSQDPVDRHERFVEFKGWFDHAFGPTIVVEEAQEENFFDQLKVADILYLHGGETLRLIDALPDFDMFKKAIEGKTIVGSSAGANYLSNVFYSPNARKIRNGSGAAGVATIVHYGATDKMSLEEWAVVVQDVKKIAQSRVFLLPEGEFVVIQS